jgi:hypothetical protein
VIARSTPSARRLADPASELALRLAGTAERRRADADRIRDLAQKAGERDLVRALVRQRILVAGLERLHATAPELAGVGERELARARRVQIVHSMMFTALTDRVCAELEAASIPVLPLKGIDLSQRLYGDVAVRSSGDVDVLIHARDLAGARDLLARLGYQADHRQRRVGGLPVLHEQLRHSEPHRPVIELHWRVHWYERRFADDVLDRSVRHPPERRRPAPIDDLACLLLFYARDGFVGLRLAMDVAAWWDRYGELLEPGALEPLVEAYPELERALVASVRVAQDVVGLPAARLLAAPRQSRRIRLAGRLANWPALGDEQQIDSDVTLIDGLLTPSAVRREWLERSLLYPREEVIRHYHLAPDDRVRWRMLQVVHPPKLSLRYMISLLRVRQGRRLAPVRSPTGALL